MGVERYRYCSGGRGLRGGGFLYDWNGLTASFRGNLLPVTENSSTGFRVASVPEPASIGLLLAGAVAGLICWRRWRYAPSLFSLDAREASPR